MQKKKKSAKIGERYFSTDKGKGGVASELFKSPNTSWYKRAKKMMPCLKDRMSTLGRRGYNFKRGGTVAGRLAKRGYGISR